MPLDDVVLALQRLVDRVSSVFVPVVLGLALHNLARNAGISALPMIPGMVWDLLTAAIALLALIATRKRWPARIKAALGNTSTCISTGLPATSGWADAAVKGCQGWIITPLT